MYENLLGLVIITSDWLPNLNLFGFCFPLMSNCSVQSWLVYHVSTAWTDFGFHLHNSVASLLSPLCVMALHFGAGETVHTSRSKLHMICVFFILPSGKVMKKWLYLTENERSFSQNGWRKVRFVTILCCEMYIVKLMKNLRNWFLLSKGNTESGL